MSPDLDDVLHAIDTFEALLRTDSPAPADEARRDGKLELHARIRERITATRISDRSNTLADVDRMLTDAGLSHIVAAATRATR